MSKIILWYWIFLLSFPRISFADLHGTLTMTTNNVDRWYTKTHNSVAVQANVDYQHSSGIYAGTNVSNVDFSSEEHPNSAQVEIVPYLGWSFKLTDQWRLDTQWSHYIYDGKLYGHQADYDEFYLFLHYNDMLTGRISFTPDYYALGNYALDYELTVKYPITDSLEFSASAGYSQTKTVLGADYPYWNAGVTYFYQFVSLDLRYMDAAETSVNPLMDEAMHDLYDPPLLQPTVVFSVSMGF